MVPGDTYLSEAGYSCVEGFAIVGPTVRVCQDSGLWSGSQPHCEGIYNIVQVSLQRPKKLTTIIILLYLARCGHV